jgi:aspartyl-tRNA(Asn)/glutamyl-tRNA(Gln) amidotransferase subunit A
VSARGPTLASLAAQLAQGKLSSRHLVEACLAQIDDDGGEGSRAFLQVDREGAQAQAETMDALRAGGAAPSPYAGIPISIKDLFDVAGQVTRAASVILAEHTPASADAASVARLRRAGFILIGRTNMTEFAFSGLGMNPHFGTPLNPWNRLQRHIPGGSSSGAAVSVTDHMAHAALGTDTGGSCRIPAAFTGLVGYKPTARRVPRQGVIPLSPSLDSVGPIARSVHCCAVLDALLADERLPEAADLPLSSLRFAIPKTVVLDGLDRSVADDFQAALSRIAASGARLEEIELPEFNDIRAAHTKGSLASAESYAWHRPLLAKLASHYDPRVRSRIEAGANQTAADYIDLLQARARLTASANERLAEFDAFLMPTVPVIAPRLDDLQNDVHYYRTNALVLRNSLLVNFLDGCAISVPMHEPGQAPTGLTLAGCHDTDRHLLRCAAAVEASLH